MGVQVAFNIVNFRARYPEFDDVPDPLIQQYFIESTIYHRNDGGGPVRDAAQQAVLLNMVVAHIAKRYATVRGEPASDIVGRISNASEGSVSVGVEMDVPPGSAQWWNTTKYGSDYWVASAPFRMMRYKGGKPRNFNPWPISGY